MEECLHTARVSACKRREINTMETYGGNKTWHNNRDCHYASAGCLLAGLVLYQYRHPCTATVLPPLYRTHLWATTPLRNVCAHVNERPENDNDKSPLNIIGR